MNKASPVELQLHFSILETRNNSFSKLIELYKEHLFGCLNRWYGKSIYNDVSLAHEAVYESLKLYFEHPRQYNPEHGCLQKFLEICVDKTIQNIFAREKYRIRTNSIDHILARYLDNDQDLQLAKLILKNEKNMAVYVALLDIGSYRINEQFFEIKRHTDRIKKTLGMIPYSLEAAKPKRELIREKQVH